MKIGLIGFFGVDAFSDDMINHATQQIFRSINPSVTFDTQVMWRCSKGAKTDVNYLNSFDLLVLCGGSLLGKCTFAPIHDLEAWARRLTIPLCIFGTAYRFEPDKEPLSQERKRRMILLFKLSKVTMLRGRISAFNCHQNGIAPQNLERPGDPLIGAAFEQPSQLRKVIGGNVRNMPFNEVQKTSNTHVENKMAAIYDWLIKETGLPLELYSFRHVADDSDVVGAQKTLHHMKHKNKASIRIFNSALHAFRSIDVSFWCGQRLHPSVYAAATGVPFVGVDTQFQKMWDFMTSINSENYINIEDGLDLFTEKFYLVTRENYMQHVAEEVKWNRQNIRNVAQKILQAAASDEG